MAAPCPTTLVRCAQARMHERVGSRRNDRCCTAIAIELTRRPPAAADHDVVCPCPLRIACFGRAGRGIEGTLLAARDLGAGGGPRMRGMSTARRLRISTVVDAVTLGRAAALRRRAPQWLVQRHVPQYDPRPFDGRSRSSDTFARSAWRPGRDRASIPAGSYAFSTVGGPRRRAFAPHRNGGGARAEASSRALRADRYRGETRSSRRAREPPGRVPTRSTNSLSVPRRRPRHCWSPGS